MKKYKLLWILIIIIVLEVLVFNFNSFRLLFGDYVNKTYNINDMSISGMKYVELNDTYFIDSKNPYIEINNINEEIATIKLNISYFDRNQYDSDMEEPTKSIPIKVYYTDENSEQYRYLPQKDIVTDIENSKYITCYLCGKSNKIRININTLKDNDQIYRAKTNLVLNENETNGNNMYYGEIHIDSIVINEKIPFNFNYFRVIILYMIICFIYFSLNSNIFVEEYRKNSYKQRLILCIIVSLFIYLSIYCIFMHNISAEKDLYSKYYVDAIIDKKLSLNIKPTSWLMELENPYDATDRYNKLSRLNTEKKQMVDNIILNGEGYNKEIISNSDYIKIINILKEYEDMDYFLWDSTYYNDQYYVYFGILPAIMFYVPFTLLTGMYLPHSVVILFMVILSLIIGYKIIILLYERYFSEVPFNILVYSLVIFLSGIMLFQLCGRPMFYEAVLSVGLFFVLLGFYYVLKIYVNEKINYLYLLISAVCFALSVMCRPTYLFVSLLILPILWKIFKNESKIKTLKAVLIVGLPYILVGTFIMYINYIRFGSILELGFSYQITINNNGNIYWKLIYFPYILLQYLFDSPSFIREFPFVQLQYYYDCVSFFGYYYYDAMIAGIIFMQPITIISLFLLKFKKYFENKKIFYLSLELLILSIVILVINSITGGINMKYFCDFSWMLVLVSLLISISFYFTIKNDKMKKVITIYLLSIAIITFIINFMIGGIVGENNLTKNCVADQYYKIRYSICFWE